ncbi:hypothetical protein [Paraburkholderia phytofirmans]|uniref:hypothetical protein n=1 Tax=Paraburkholderia phytofirmans TaxID=261302 RepID=UPI001F1E9161|nr:hypothetical protein [Paraburkholderia phytofirmans]
MDVEAAASAQAAHHISNMDGYAATGRFNHERHPQRRRSQVSTNLQCAKKNAAIRRP